MSVVMTNAELAEAIAYAFQCCDQKYVGGYETSQTNVGEEMLSHLKELLALQRARAGMIEAEKLKARYEAIGWCHAFCCAALDDGKDPRQIDCAEIIEKANAQLSA